MVDYGYRTFMVGYGYMAISEWSYWSWRKRPEDTLKPCLQSLKKSYNINNIIFYMPKMNPWNHLTPLNLYLALPVMVILKRLNNGNHNQIIYQINHYGHFITIIEQWMDISNSAPDDEWSFNKLLFLFAFSILFRTFPLLLHRSIYTNQIHTSLFSCRGHYLHQERDLRMKILILLL